MDIASAARNGTRLPHLSGVGAEVRQVLAAHYLRDCETILEIGGAGLPITGYLTHTPRAVRVIDPKIEPMQAAMLNGSPCDVRHIAAKFQNVPIDLDGRALGLVLLGLSLKPLGGTPAISPALLTLMRRARTVVIDHARQLARANAQIAAILAIPGLEMHVDLDIELKDPALAGSAFGARRFLVLRPAPLAAGNA